VFNRTRERAEALAAHFGPRVKAYDWSERGLRSRKAAVLVNTTTIGLNGVGSLDLDFHVFDASCVVADIVYVPLETELIVRAQGRGLRTVDGLGMLLHQAVPGFEKWFGVRPEVTEALRAILVADIAGAETC
jgi:shikimate dehydrogenase